MNEWIGEGIWAGWRLTTDHADSSYGQPVLVDPDGVAYGPGDIRRRIYQADLAREEGVTPAAITGRINRGTLPPFDGVEQGRGYWYPAPSKMEHPEKKKRNTASNALTDGKIRFTPRMTLLQKRRHRRRLLTAAGTCGSTAATIQS